MTITRLIDGRYHARIGRLEAVNHNRRVAIALVLRHFYPKEHSHESR